MFGSFKNSSCLGLAMLLVAAAPAEATPVSDLAGRWSGWGSVTLGNGSSEQLKCVATYFLQGGGDGLQQNLRCASASYKIDATVNLAVRGGAVTGSWEEKTWSSTGLVNGRMSANGFDLAIKGPNFSAAMAMTVSACKQTINIAPQGFDISRISIGLGKC